LRKENRVGPGYARVAGDVEAGVVEVGQDRFEEIPDRVLAEVRGDVTDPQQAIRGGVVGVRSCGGRQGRGVPLGPAAVLLKEGLWGLLCKVGQGQQT
jgi:hypothetical protein